MMATSPPRGLCSANAVRKVMALKARRARLFSSVLDDGHVFGTTLDADDIHALLS